MVEKTPSARSPWEKDAFVNAATSQQLGEAAGADGGDVGGAPPGSERSKTKGRK